MNTPKTHCRICLLCSLTCCLTCCGHLALHAQDVDSAHTTHTNATHDMTLADSAHTTHTNATHDMTLVDSSYTKSYYNYFTLTLLTGAGFLLSGNNDNTIQASFPYSVTDAAGVRTDTLFNSPAVKPYRYPKLFIGPLAMEIGGLRQFFTMSFSFQIIGNWTNGYNFAMGYGHNFYLNGFTHRSRNPAEKAIQIRPYIQIAYTEDNAFNDPAILGTIDNSNKTIEVFGHTAGPNFTVTTYSRYGSSSQTYTSRSLDIAYAQSEWALMPRISIANSPYLHTLRFELVIGYNIPISERGGIFVYQTDGGENRQGIAGKFSLSQPNLTVNYNNQPVRSAPYRFSNYYLGMLISLSRWGHRKRTPPRVRQKSAPRPARRHYYAPADKEE